MKADTCTIIRLTFIPSYSDINLNISEFEGEYNIIKNNLNAVVKMMGELLDETDKIIKAAADGDLDKRANADLFAGGWNKLVSGVNDTITNIVNPLMVTADYVARISLTLPPSSLAWMGLNL